MCKKNPEPRPQPIRVAALPSEPNFKKIIEKATVTAKDQTIFAHSALEKGPSTNSICC